MNILNKISSCSCWKQFTPKISIHHHVLISALRLCMSKEDIVKCPIKRFDGKIHLISCNEDEHSQSNRDILDLLLSSSVVGFDTEAAVTFNRNIDPLPTALVQIAIHDHVVLWRLRRNRKFVYRKHEFPAVLKNILTNKNIKKVGAGCYGDIKDLYTQYNITLRNVKDNQVLAKKLGFSKIGLASLAAQLFGWRVLKDQQLSNWESSKLDKRQLLYAATDAWASLLIYDELLSISEALQVTQSSNHEKTAFEQILRTEAAIDSDILHILDTQRNEIQKQKEQSQMSWSVDDYDVAYLIASCEKTLKIDSLPDINASKVFSSLRKKEENQKPFLYQPM